MRQRFIELQVGQNFLVGGLDVLAMPTFLLNEYGMVAHLNESAKNLLETHSNLWMHNKYLRTNINETTKLLNLEIFNAIEVSRGKNIDLNSTILLPRAGAMPLMLLISPVHRAGTSTPLGGALLFAFDPLTTPKITVDLVCKLFSLSKGEAKLAIALCEGKTLEDIALENGTSIHTVKSQLKNTFLKTGTKRQSELVSLLLASPAYFLAAK
jgi:DNA-binding CsgD family transcriptional regulator